MTQNHYLYRLYGQLRELLYVGITSDLPTRFADHRKGKRWWPEVSSFTVDTYPDREAVLEAELQAIQLEQPRYNSMYAQPRDFRFTPKWQQRFRLELPEDISKWAESDYIRAEIASEIKEWSNGYDGRTGCLLIHPELFETLVDRIARIQNQEVAHADPR